MANIYLHTAEVSPKDIRLREVADDTQLTIPAVISTVIFLYAASEVNTLPAQDTGEVATLQLRPGNASPKDIQLFDVTDGNFRIGQPVKSVDILLYDPLTLFSPGGDVIIHGHADLSESEILQGVQSTRVFGSLGITEQDLLQGILSALRFGSSGITEQDLLQGNASGKVALSSALTESELLAAIIKGKGTISAALSDGETLTAIIKGLISLSTVITESEVLSALISGKGICSSALAEAEILTGNILGLGSLIASLQEQERLEADVTGRGFISSQTIEAEALRAIIHNGAWMHIFVVAGARFAVVHNNTKVFSVIKL